MGAIKSAIDEVQRDSRGLPVAVVEARLVSALRKRDAFLPIKHVRCLARDMADPWWPVKHPVQAMREVRSHRTSTDPDSTRLEAEADHLEQRFDLVDQVTEMSSRRTFDGIVHEVTIDPWSPRLAARIHRLASPIRVVVKRPG
jgi:hypothetical protein